MIVVGSLQHFNCELHDNKTQARLSWSKSTVNHKSNTILTVAIVTVTIAVTVTIVTVTMVTVTIVTLTTVIVSKATIGWTC